MEAAGLQNLAYKHEPGSIPHQEFDPVRSLRTEDEGHARERLEPQLMLDQRGKADRSLALMWSST